MSSAHVTSSRPNRNLAGARAIHAHLGQESLTTITKFLREIEADAPKQENQAETQEAFRQFWSLAIDAGRKDAQAQIKEPEDNHLISGVAAFPAVHVRTIFPAIPLLATVST